LLAPFARLPLGAPHTKSSHPLSNYLNIWLNPAPPTFNDWISDWSRRGFHDPFDDCDDSPPGARPPAPAPAPAQVPAVSSPLPTVREEPELGWNFWENEMRIEAQEKESQTKQPELGYSFSISTTTPLSPSNPFLPYLVSEEQHRNHPEKPSFSYSLFSSISNSSQEDQADDHEMNVLNANFHDFFTWSKFLIALS